MENKKRVTKRLKCPNPLFVKWLTEWKDKAKKNESKMEYCFAIALKSLQKYPLPLETGKDCKILHGFGDKLCKMLDEKLAEHRENDNQPVAPRIQPNPISPVKNNDVVVELQKPKSKKQKLPIVRTDSGVSSTSTNNLGSSSSQQLSEKLKAKKQKVPIVRTDSGVSTTSSNLGSSSSQQSTEKSASQKSTSTTPSIREEVIFAPSLFQIVLLIDTAEVNGNDDILTKLRGRNIDCEVRNMKVGDYLWICRSNDTKVELVLPYIIERKRVDDFGKSIKDGRFHEQKFRLKQSGIQNMIYLIESYGQNKFTGLPMPTLHQAATNTAVQDGFIIKYTNGLQGTADYLTVMSNLIVKLYHDKTIINCTKEDLKPISLNEDLIFLIDFEEFNKSSVKNKPMKVKDMFIRQLIQIKGMSIDRALAIVEQYPTPLLLKLGFESVSQVYREKFLSNIHWGPLNKKLGPVLSKTIYQLFSKDFYS